MKKKKYLPLYYKWMETGKIGTDGHGKYNGMCQLFNSDPLFHLFYQYIHERADLALQGQESIWWASGFDGDEYLRNKERVKSEFTPLRQTMVLFMAAMNNEL